MSVNCVRAWGGLSYYRNFTSEISARTKATNGLLEKGVKLHITPEDENTVRETLGELSGSNVWYVPDYAGAMSGSRPCMLVTGASEYGWVAVVEQRHSDGDGRPLRVSSRSTPPDEHNWIATEVEAGAIVWTVQRNRPLLFWNYFPNLQRSSTSAKFVQSCRGSAEGPALARFCQCLHLSDFLQTWGVRFERRHVIVAHLIR